MAKKSDSNVVREVFSLLVILASLAIIFGGLALVILFSPMAQNIYDNLIAMNIRFIVYLITVITIGGITVLLSALVVYSKNVVHSALYLLGSFASIAALYIVMNATFVGIAQVLVYIGAVGVLILFAVMLTRKTIVEESHGEI